MGSEQKKKKYVITLETVGEKTCRNTAVSLGPANKRL